MRRVFALALALPLAASASEGHWRPAQLHQLSAELRELGLQVPLTQLADPKARPLGAIVDLGTCSGAFLSPDGLIATAYHCITEGLQYASHEGENLFENGFYAAERGQDRWLGPDVVVRVTTATEEVTDKVLAGTARLSGAERLDRVEHNIKALVRRCESSEDLHCEVAKYGDGAEYELITKLELRDVRLVYAPPRAVGYFGGDQDNWRWPRHSGDFAFLRAYVSPTSRSVANHPANVPHRPAAWLPLSAKGVEPGEFVMVAGYPQWSYRWRSAAEVDFAQEEALPVRVSVRRDMMGVLDALGKRDVRLVPRLAPRLMSLSNDLIYFEGTLDQLRRAGTATERWEFERDLARWIAGSPERSAEWGTVLDRIHRLQAEEAATTERDYLVRQMTTQVDLLDAALRIWKLAQEAEKADKDRAPGFQNRDRPRIAAELDQMDPRFDPRVDRAVLRYFILRLSRLPAGQRIPELSNWLDVGPQDDLERVVDAKLDALYDDLALADADERRALMGTTAWFLQRSSNPWFGLALALAPFRERVAAEERAREADWREVKPHYIQAVQAFYPEARPRYLVASRRIAPGVYYPDANQTLRVSIGKVDGYAPRDGLIAAPQTTLEGLAAKAGDAPYDAPAKLLDAIASGDRGPWVAPRLGTVPVNFTTTLDTARGSSGSATLNARGEFVGVIFDGNYESIASDWMFDPDMTRSIHTDVRYILWYLDRCAKATRLLEELGVEPHFATLDGVGEAR